MIDSRVLVPVGSRRLQSPAKPPRFLVTLLGGLVLCAAAVPRVEACSEIYFKIASSHLISARNFDFMTGDGSVRFSPAGVVKQTQYAPQGCQPLTWTSRYASLTFDTVLAKSGSPEDGFYYAGVDGINQAGLKVGTYFLAESKFAEHGVESTIDISSLMEYLLDSFSSVDEAVQDLSSGRYRVTATPTGLLDVMLHFLVHDASGASAVVEFLDGRTTVIRDPEVPVLTNTPYLESSEHLEHFAGFGGQQAIPGTNDSLDRFVRGAFYRRHLDLPDDAATAVRYGFAVVQTVSVSPKFAYGSTQWSIVSDIQHRQVFFRTLGNPNVASIDLVRLAAAGKEPSEVDLLRTDLIGDITDLFVKADASGPAAEPPAQR